ncbi:MAG: cysteine desulfurase CsdA [Kiritimatiellaceae bacterium]|mgnify:FL=1|nr:cysteine desulfurase CsdA [Kiritimatiellaceae bacterium]
MSDSQGTYDVEAVRSRFPIFSREVHGQPLCYLDSGASAQQPDVVIDTVSQLHSDQYANVHRGVHTLSMESTELYDGAREKVRAYLNAASLKEIIFTRGATESVNLVAQSYARPKLQAGDEILITHMEHHSNIVPWQLVCEQTGAVLKVVPINDRGELEMDAFHELLSERTKLVGLVHISNALGTVNPIAEVIEAAHAKGIPVLVDGAQGAPHAPVDVQALDVDFYVFSGHKLYGPTGIGVLYGKESLLEAMPPYQGGGDMILSVRFEGTEYNALPYRFEAGTPNISGAVGLGRAIDFVNEIGIEAIAAHEQALVEYATDQLSAIEEVKIIGTAEHRAGLVSFVIEGVHPHDIGTMLDSYGIAIRAGHHCAQPVMERFGIAATARASFGMYSTREEVDRLVDAVKKVIGMFA